MRAAGLGAILLVAAACGGAAPTPVEPSAAREPAPARVVTTSKAPEPGPPWVLETAATAEPEARPKPFDLAAVVADRRREPVAGYVVAPRSVRLFATEKAARAHGASPEELPMLDTSSATDHRPSSGLLLRVAQDLGDVVAIDTISSETGHCAHAGSPYELSWVELRLFLRKADLLPVLKHDVELPFDDGTGVSLAAGTMVGLPALSWHGEPAVYAGGYHLEVPIVANDIALSYQPSQFRIPRRNLDYRLPERPLRLRGRPWLRRSRYGSDEVDLSPSGDGLAEVHERCITLFLGIEGELEEARGGGGVMAGIGGLGRGRKKKKPKKVKVWREYTKKGGAVMWPDGTKAGTIRWRRRLEVEPTTQGRLRCYVFDDDAPYPNPLCLPAASVDRVLEEIIKR